MCPEQLELINCSLQFIYFDLKSFIQYYNYIIIIITIIIFIIIFV